MNPLFSIIIPVYNVEKILPDCLDSVINQTIKDFEIICINDGSNDNSSGVLEQYAINNQKIKIINQNNRGPSSARNTGIKASRGSYLFFLDSDDWIEENTLKILQNTIKEQDLICFNGKKYYAHNTEEIFSNNYHEENLSGWEYYNKYAALKRNLHFDCAVSRLYKRTLIFNNNLFFKEGILHEDTLFTTLACYYAKEVTVISNSLYVYRIREGSITQTKNKKRMLDRIKIANILSDFFIPLENIEKKIIYRIIAGMYFGLLGPNTLYNPNYLDLLDNINWSNFKKVCIYPRHKRIYFLLRLNPRIYLMYRNIENTLKKNLLFNFLY